MILVLAKKRKSAGENTKEPLPYFRKKTLLNEKEQVLFHRLIEAMPTCYVMAQEDRQKADENKDEALKAAGIPIIRIEASKLTSTEEIKILLENAVLHKKSP